MQTVYNGMPLDVARATEMRVSEALQTSKWEEAQHRPPLSFSTFATTQLPTTSTISLAIIGGGVSGLTFAHQFRDEKPHIFERSASLGGVWNLHANTSSRVNSSEPSYRFALSEGKNTNHTPRSEILRDVSIMAESLPPGHIHTGVEVVCVERNKEGGFVLSCTRGGQQTQIRCTKVFVCTNKRLGEPRDIALPAQDVFPGEIIQGIKSECNSVDYTGKRVLILGMGAFAIEAMRTALERGASHVQFLSRRRGVVCPQIVDWCNFVRTLREDFTTAPAGNAAIFSHWRRLYHTCKAVVPECWAEGKLKPDGHTVSVSDLFFIASYFGMVSTEVGVVTGIDKQGNIQHATGSFQADIIVKCMGFEQREHGLVGSDTMTCNGRVEPGLWIQAEPYLDSSAFQTPFGSSYLSMVSFNSKVLHYLLSNTVEMPHMPTCRIADFCMADYMKGIHHMIHEDDKIRFLLRAHVDSVSSRAGAYLDCGQYIQENRSQWNLLHKILNRSPVIAYPFDNLFEEVPDLSLPTSAPPMNPTTSSSAVYASLKEVVGKLTGKTPEPEEDILSTIDSLQVVELRYMIEETLGQEIPTRALVDCKSLRELTDLLSDVPQKEVPPTPPPLRTSRMPVEYTPLPSMPDVQPTAQASPLKCIPPPKVLSTPAETIVLPDMFHNTLHPVPAASLSPLDNECHLKLLYKGIGDIVVMPQFQVAFGHGFQSYNLWQMVVPEDDCGVVSIVACIKKRLPMCSCVIGISWGSCLAVNVAAELKVAAFLIDPPPASVPRPSLHNLAALTLQAFTGQKDPNLARAKIWDNAWECAVLVSMRMNIGNIDRVRNLVQYIQMLQQVPEGTRSDASVFVTLSSQRKQVYNHTEDDIAKYGRQVYLTGLTAQSHMEHIEEMCKGTCPALMEALERIHTVI